MFPFNCRCVNCEETAVKWWKTQLSLIASGAIVHEVTAGWHAVSSTSQCGFSLHSGNNAKPVETLIVFCSQSHKTTGRNILP